MKTAIGTLDTTVVQRNAGRPRAAVILCHGYGAPGDDLVGLADALIETHPSLKDVRFYFPSAPLSLGQTGYGEGRAWWSLDMVQLQKVQRGSLEDLRQFREKEPEGLPAARKALSAMVNEVLKQTGLPMNALVLGGFSQGAMLSTDVTLRLEEAPAALAILSGTLLTESVWHVKAQKRAGLRVFQSHGTQDPVLRFDAAQLLQNLLTHAGAKLEFVQFNGGHGIPPQVLTKLAAFIDISIQHRTAAP